MNLSFRNWLFEYYLMEMARVNFGAHQGKDHSQLPTHYLQWMQKQATDGSRFNLSDKDRPLPQADVRNLINQEISRRQQPVSRNIQTTPIQPTQQPQNNQQSWIWAKSVVAKPEYNLPAANLNLAMRQSGENNWMFVILDPEEGRLVSRGKLPTVELKNLVKSERGPDGQTVKGNKPSDILRAITPKKEKSNSNLIPDNHITEEQKSIEDRFVKIMNSPQQNHMVISALAGSGKTTVLKHLAWKFSKGQKWLYLVFNAKNKEEAKEEFPPNVQVETTNGWAGREVLGKNLLKPTDRIQDFSSSNKANMIADSAGFSQLTQSLKIPDQNKQFGKDPKQLSRTDRTVWYLLRSINSEFKSEAVKMLGLVKSFAVDPRKENFESEVKAVMDQYDINTNLEDIKEKMLKNSPWASEEISKLMGQNFVNRDFTEELKKATIWLMQQAMPHASQEEFTADAGNQKGSQQLLGTKRDFDDDLWYAAIHANELKWPKYDVVLADETQDFNSAQKIILQKLAENGAKVVAVGDQNQSIYRFRGADSNAFSGIKDTLTNLSHDKNVEQNLTRNFRSRQAVIDMANNEGQESGHVSNLVKGRPFKEEPGRIGVGQATKYEQKYDQAFDTLKSEMQDMGEIKQTAFLARTNEPLVHASLRLMKDKIPFVILGKDIANDLSKHIDRIINLFKMNNNSSVEEFESSINSYNSEQQDTHHGKAAMSGKMKELKETTDAMSAAIQQFIEEKRDGSVLDFKRWLRDKFGGIDLDKSGREGDALRAEYKKKLEEQNPVILSTVHKSKGLQFQRVYILRDDLWPHPRSTRKEDLDQEANNRYIALTRAEDSSHILALKGQPGYRGNDEEE